MNGAPLRFFYYFIICVPQQFSFSTGTGGQDGGKGLLLRESGEWVMREGVYRSKFFCETLISFIINSSALVFPQNSSELNLNEI